MKRIWMVVALVAVVAAFGAVGTVFAQDATPPTPPAPGQGYGYGMMGRGMMGGAAGTGLLHDYMEPAMAEALGLTVEELEAKHAEGLSFYQIAEAQGLSVEEAQQLMLDARSTALDAAVADGVITAEQADWMKTRMSSGHMGRGYGAGGCAGMGGYNNGSADGTAGTFRGRGMMGGRW